MNSFDVGDVVQATGPVMTGNVGTIISIDEQRGRYLVLVSGVTQTYFAQEDLRSYPS